jgi:hypothetical protein
MHQQCGPVSLLVLLLRTGWSYLLAAAGGALAVVALGPLKMAAGGFVSKRIAAVRASQAYRRRYHMPPAGDDGDSGTGDGQGNTQVSGAGPSTRPFMS